MASGAGGGLVAAGVAIALLGGLCNATWNIFAKPSAPLVMRVVATPLRWAWEHLWLAFTVCNMVANAAFCLGVIAPRDIGTAYSQADAAVVIAVVIFSFVWGFGTMLFSMAVQLLGAALGTSIAIITTMVTGTLLPIIVLYPKEFGSVSGILTIVGALIAATGIGFAARASILKHLLPQEELKHRGTKPPREEEAKTTGIADADVDVEVAEMEPLEKEKEREPATVQVEPQPGAGTPTGVEAAEAPRSASVSVPLPCGAVEIDPMTFGILVSLGAGVVSALLQFAFVFGLPLIDTVEDEGYSSAVSSSVVWLLAFSLSGVPNVILALYIIGSRGTFDRFWVGGIVEQLKNWARCAVMAVVFVAHIHGYGAGQALLGDLGPAIMWPLLMSSTMLFGQAWGQFLGEWDGVNRVALRTNWTGIGIIIAAIAILTGAGLAGV